MKAIFVADIHLNESQPQITQLFLNYLNQLQVEKPDQLYILGDLFEYWIGDDDISELSQTIERHLMTLSNLGVSIFYIHGNRDFMIGNQFAKRAGMQLLEEKEIIDINGQKILIMHGDTLCTDDTDYQEFRKKVRNKKKQKNFLLLPLFFRKYKAKQIRKRSIQNKKSNSLAIMDVNQNAVEQSLTDAKVDTLIHGHTHKKACHVFSIGEKTHKRYVLGDWGLSGSALVITENNIEFKTIRFI